MATKIGLILLFSAVNVIFSVDEVILTSAEKKSPESVDMSFGETDPVAISEVKREPAVQGEKKQKRDDKSPVMDPKMGGARMPRPPGTEVQKIEPVVPVSAPAEEKKEENKDEDRKEEPKKAEKRQADPTEEKKNVEVKDDEKKEEPIKVQKRHSEQRQNRAKKPPVPRGTADKDGIETAQ